MPHQRLTKRHPDPARVAALRTLRAVTDKDAYANLELAKQLSAAHLDARDAAFATELVAGTCRALGTYDRIIAAASGRTIAQLKPDVLDVLRLGTHQLLAMRVPSRAAVAATVELAGAEVGEKVVGLTNAILRKVDAHDLDGWIAELSHDEDEVGALALATSHPRWIVEAYLDLLGDEAPAALAANNEAPVTTLVVRPGLADRGELAGDPTPFSPFGVRHAGNPAELEEVAQGRVGVQDEGSQLVAWALTRPDAPGGPWLDLCAGPGGKAALLAGLACGAGERLVASEVAPHRATLVRSGLRAYAPVVFGPDSRADDPTRPIVICADGTQPAWPAGRFARVMADVPCSGLGALRRRPESRWRRSPSDLDDLVPLQRRLLSSAMDAAAPGGVVAYVTCSPHRRETIEVVDAVLAEHPDAHRLHAADALPDVPDCALGDDVQLWPHRHGTDAMFLSLVRKDA